METVKTTQKETADQTKIALWWAAWQMETVKTTQKETADQTRKSGRSLCRGRVVSKL